MEACIKLLNGEKITHEELEDYQYIAFDDIMNKLLDENRKEVSLYNFIKMVTFDFIKQNSGWYIWNNKEEPIRWLNPGDSIQDKATKNKFVVKYVDADSVLLYNNKYGTALAYTKNDWEIIHQRYDIL